MFCSFEEMPLILRLYGNAKIFHENEEEYVAYSPLFDKHVGARQIIEMDIDLVQSSCGYAVPVMEFKEERTQLNESDIKKGRAGVKKYWEEYKNDFIKTGLIAAFVFVLAMFNILFEAHFLQKDTVHAGG